LPHPSVATQWRVIVKSAIELPGVTVSVKVTVAPLQLSVAVATPSADGSVAVAQETVTLAGQLITGGVLSTTVMVCAQLELLPLASVAVQVRVMV
jgi:hypothetical protein